MAESQQWTQRLVDLYAETVPDHLVKHHIDSYNQYVRDRITGIIKQFNPVNEMTTQDGAYTIRVLIGGPDGSKVYFKRPMVRTPAGKTTSLTPQMARELGTSYVFRASADVLIQYEARPGGDIVEKWFHDVHIMKVPILLRSEMCVLAGKGPDAARAMEECPFDPGAYFIIDGKEKVIVSQEKLADHKLITSWNKTDKSAPLLQVAVRCTSVEDRFFPKNHEFQVNHADHASFPYGIYVNPPIIRSSHMRVPLAILFKALGVISDRDMMGWIADSRSPLGSIAEIMMHSVFAAGHVVRTREEAVQYLARMGGDTVQKVEYELERDFMPHAGRDPVNKAAMLGSIVREIITFVATDKHVDRDSMATKRVDVSGFLLTYVTRDMIYRWRKAALYGISAAYQNGAWRNTGDVRLVVNAVNFASIFNDKQIDRAMMANFKVNKRWAIRKNATDQEAIVQDLKRVSFIGTVSHLRRINTPLSDKTKAVPPHALQSTHWGIVCPSETPDGASIGLLKHLALMTSVTYDCGEDIRKVLVDNCDMVTLDRMCIMRRQKWDTDVFVLLNNVWIGIFTPNDDVVAICEYLRLLRRNAMINCMISISFNASKRTLSIGTEQGRCTRPLLIVQDGRIALQTKQIVGKRTNKLTWWDLVVKGQDPYNLDIRIPHGKRAYENAATLNKLRADAAPIEYVDVEEALTLLVAMHPSEVTRRHTHCEIHPMTILSWTAANLALIHHNPAPRVLNACGQSKQAIGVFATSFRKRFDTEAYVMSYAQRPLLLSSMARHCYTTQLPGGQNLMTMIATFTGYNQEDAIIVNRASVDRGCLSLTAYHTMVHSETSKEDGGKRLYDPASSDIQRDKLDLSKVDDSGVIRTGSRVKFDTVVAAMRTDTRDVSTADNMFGGIVDRTQLRMDDATGLRTASIVVRDFRSCTVGDKLASRFYNKGVVGVILPEYEMPWMPDGTVPDIIINPHAFPSRMTAGQLLEMCVGMLCCKSGAGVSLAPLDPVSTRLIDAATQHATLHTVAYSPLHGRQMEVDVAFGCGHYIRMKQQVIDKVASRAYGRVDNITYQPVRGRSNEGGLKLGGMETAAVISHGLASFYTEASMQKGDGQLMRVDEDGTVPHQEATTQKTMALPRAFATFTHEMRTGLGVDMRIAYAS